MTSWHNPVPSSLRNRLRPAVLFREQSASRLLFWIGAICTFSGPLLIILASSTKFIALGSALTTAGAACLIAGMGFVVARARHRERTAEVDQIRMREAALALAARLHESTNHSRQHFAHSRLLDKRLVLTKHDFGHAILDYAEWSLASLQQCAFDRASLIGATLDCDGTETRFLGAQLERAKLVGFFNEASFSGARCGRADFRQAWLEFSTFARSEDGSLTYLREANFSGSDALDGVNFSGVLAEGADFTHTTMYGTIFQDAFLCAARFDHANLDGCNLHGAMLSDQQTARRASFQSTDLGSEDSFMASDLSETWLLGIDLSTTKGVEHANLTGALANAGTTFPVGMAPEDHGVLMLHLMPPEDRIAAMRNWIERHARPAGWFS
jgi:uncharacterized protein YjbI with pentapeptide repeats